MPKKIPTQVKLVKESKIKQSRDNKHISYSQLTSFASCPKQWYLTYVKKLAPYDPSIHAVFGTAMHETIQEWLSTIYNETVKKANEMNLHVLLHENMVKAFKSTKAQNSHQAFSSPEEMQLFYLDGIHILDWLKRKRGAYFSTKGTYLAGVETLLYQELRPKVFFKGYIDLVFYNETVDKWLIVDIKTSTSGWNKWAKEDEKKIAQILLYKEFFAKQFDIDVDKIDIEYFILKRRVPVDAEYPAMEKRVQQFVPASGKIKRGKAISMMNHFVKETLDEDGNYIEKDYEATPSKNSCMFCIFKGNPICPQAFV